MGRSKAGVFRNVRAENLSAELIKALLVRNAAVKPKDIEDVGFAFDHEGAVFHRLDFNVCHTSSFEMTALSTYHRNAPSTGCTRLAGNDGRGPFCASSNAAAFLAPVTRNQICLA